MKVSSISVLLLALTAALLLAACGSPTPSGPVGDAARGGQRFAGTCVSCHGPDAKGIAGLGKDLTTSEFVKSKSDSELVAFIQAGRPASDALNTTGVDMPPKGGNPALTEQDLADVVAYLRTMQK